jgi:DNA-binding transcriptional MerR regulator
MATELERKIIEALEDGFSSEEIKEAMKEEGYQNWKIKAALSKAERNVKRKERGEPTIP